MSLQCNLMITKPFSCGCRRVVVRYGSALSPLNRLAQLHLFSEPAAGRVLIESSQMERRLRRR